MKNRDNLERARDEMHLAWIVKIESGVTSGQIGKQYGIRPSNVRTVLGRIKKDCEE